MSDHPDIIWVNEYPGSAGVAHLSRAKAEANVMRDGTTAAYQRLPDGVDPETHEQVTYWLTLKNGQVWDWSNLPPSEIGGLDAIPMTGWLPKPQPEPETQADLVDEQVITDLAQMQARAASDSRFWFPQVHETQQSAVVHFALGLAGEVGEVVNIIKKWNREDEWPDLEIDPKLGDLSDELADCLIYLLDLADEVGVGLATAVESKRKVLIERWGDPSDESKPADPPKPYVPAPKDIFKVGDVLYQRSREPAGNWFSAWNLDESIERWFELADIESGAVVCERVTDDE